MELSEAQFEQLVGMLADNRVGITNAKNEIMNELEKTKRELKAGQTLLASQLAAVEEDVGKVQTSVRGYSEEFRKIDRSMDGVTKLCKSTWDNMESLQKHVHEEMSREGHVAGHESHRAQ